MSLLQEALNRRGDVKIEICAILNDTTGSESKSKSIILSGMDGFFTTFSGCLMSCAWKDDRCRIGLILGTGTNACYLEEVKDIHIIDKEKFLDQVKIVFKQV